MKTEVLVNCLRFFGVGILILLTHFGPVNTNTSKHLNFHNNLLIPTDEASNKSLESVSKTLSRKGRSGYAGAGYNINCYYCNIFNGGNSGGGSTGHGSGETEEGTEVLNGQRARDGEFPFVVYVSSGGALCGGAIYDRQHILTAAHCVFDKTNNQVKDASMVSILAGNVDRNNGDGSGQYIGASQICVHSGYPNTPGMDIAVIKLSRALSFNDRVRVAVILRYQTQDYEATGTVAGWGRVLNSAGTASVPGGTRYMQTAQVSVYNPETVCGYADNPGNVMCAGTDQPQQDTAPTATCSGDSGSPLGCSVGGFKYDACGLVSYGVRSCDTINSMGKMSVFTKIAPKMQWVGMYVEQNQCS